MVAFASENRINGPLPSWPRHLVSAQDRREDRPLETLDPNYRIWRAATKAVGVFELAILVSDTIRMPFHSGVFQCTLQQLQDLDPTTEDFLDRVTAAHETAVENETAREREESDSKRQRRPPGSDDRRQG